MIKTTLTFYCYTTLQLANASLFIFLELYKLWHVPLLFPLLFEAVRLAKLISALQLSFGGKRFWSRISGFDEGINCGWWGLVWYLGSINYGGLSLVKRWRGGRQFCWFWGDGVDHRMTLWWVLLIWDWAWALDLDWDGVWFRFGFKILRVRLVRY